LFNKLKINKTIDIKKKLKGTKNLSIKVGFPSLNQKTSSTDTGGISAIDKATINNFGLGVPKRPFMSISFAKNKKIYKGLILKHFSNINNADNVEFYNKLGLKGQGDVQKEIIALRTPANSQSTIDAKGSSNPLIDTGHMLQSVTFSVGEKQ